MKSFIVRVKGGQGSGNFGHCGIPGQQGGSQDCSGSTSKDDPELGMYANLPKGKVPADYEFHPDTSQWFERGTNVEVNPRNNWKPVGLTRGVSRMASAMGHALSDKWISTVANETGDYGKQDYANRQRLKSAMYAADDFVGALGAGISTKRTIPGGMYVELRVSSNDRSAILSAMERAGLGGSLKIGGEDLFSKGDINAVVKSSGKLYTTVIFRKNV